MRTYAVDDHDTDVSRLGILLLFVGLILFLLACIMLSLIFTCKTRHSLHFFLQIAENRCVFVDWFAMESLKWLSSGLSRVLWGSSVPGAFAFSRARSGSGKYSGFIRGNF